MTIAQHPTFRRFMRISPGARVLYCGLDFNREEFMLRLIEDAEADDLRGEAYWAYVVEMMEWFIKRANRVLAAMGGWYRTV